MPNDLTPPDPSRFGLTSFAELLPARDHILGEDPGSFDGFRGGMMQSLVPVTPYEGVIAENLVAIEWELLQHRRMRDAGLRKVIRNHIRHAVIRREQAAHERALDQAFDLHEARGGTNEDWEEPFSFDEEAAERKGDALAAKADPARPEGFTAACSEIEELGLNPVELMGAAYQASGKMVSMHEEKLQELERRRRDVKRDFDALQKARPTAPETIEGETVGT